MSRILFLVSSMNGGGAERDAALLCNHWVQEGHEVTLMPTFSGRGNCVYPLHENVSLEFLADRVGSKTQSVTNKIRRLAVLRQAVREIEPDVIVSFLPNVNVAAILCAWGLGIPVVVGERTYPPAMPVGRVLETLRRLLYPHASFVTVQTRQALEWLADCCPKARGVVIPNPVYFPLPHGEPALDPAIILSPGQKFILAVGRLVEEKGFHQLLTAFATLASRYRKWDLVILGEGPKRAELETARDRLGLSNRVHLPGRAGNPGDWYKKGDFFVLSSRFEGFPNTLSEAMAYGLPVISFDCDTGPADLVRDEIDGFLVPPSRGSQGLAEKMELLMGDPDLRQRIGEASLSVRNRFSPGAVLNDWNKLMGLDRKD